MVIMIGIVEVIILVLSTDSIDLQTSEGALENLWEVEHDEDLPALGVPCPLVLLPLVDPVEGHLLGWLSLVTLHLEEKIGNQKQGQEQQQE